MSSVDFPELPSYFPGDFFFGRREFQCKQLTHFFAESLLSSREFSIPLSNINEVIIAAAYHKVVKGGRAGERRRLEWACPLVLGQQISIPAPFPSSFALSSLSWHSTWRETEGEEKTVAGVGGVGWHMGRRREQSSIGYISSRMLLPLWAAFLILSASIICRSHRAQTGRARTWESASVYERVRKVISSLALSFCLLIEW